VAEVISNPLTEYRVRIAFQADYTEFHLDVPGFSELDSATLGPDPAVYTWADVTADVQQVTVRRGRARTTDNTASGTATLTLLDLARDYDTENTSSPYYPDLPWIGSPLEVSYRRTSPTWHEIYVGTIDIVQWESNPAGFNVASFVASDTLAQLARQALLTDTTFAAAPSGTRINDILNQAVEVSAATSIDAGTVTLVERTESAGANLLDLANRASMAEFGEFFAANDGTLVFRQRYSNANPEGYTLTANTSGAQYSALTIEYANNLYTQVNVTDDTGAVQSARVDSLTASGSLDVDTGGLLAASDALNLAEYLIDAFGQPGTAVTTVEVPVVTAISAATQDLLLQTDLDTVVEVERTWTTGTPSLLSEWYGVESIEHRISPERHTMIFGLGSKTSAGWLELDSAAYGTLDTNKLA